MEVVMPSAPSAEQATQAAGLARAYGAGSGPGACGAYGAYGAVGTEDTCRRVSQGLVQMGVPVGLAQLVAEEDRFVALRVFVLDNSGSTGACDGKYLETEAGGGQMRMVSCSRWEEIRRLAMQQATANAHVGVPCEFVLLNPPAHRGFGAWREGLDFTTVDATKGEVHAQLEALAQMLRNTRPEGTTPLGERLREVHHRIKNFHGDLASKGFRCVVVVATDGLPTSCGTNLSTDAARMEVVQALRNLTCELRAFVVVRLTTDEEAVVQYYNRLDEEEELSLEVIDDIESEAREVQAHGNGWLVYSPQLHMIREGGTFVRMFDALDERPLTQLEVKSLVARVLQSGEEEEPLPSPVDEFMQLARRKLCEAPLAYNPLTRRMVPCLDEGRLRVAVGASWSAQCMTWCWIALRRPGSGSRAPLISG